MFNPRQYQLEWDYLLARVKKVGECWEWTRALEGQGYPSVNNWMYDKYGTHKVCQIVLIISGHPRPGKEYGALHTCDNTVCINPDHLWWGTNNDNVQDKMKKGRYVPGVVGHTPEGRAKMSSAAQTQWDTHHEEMAQKVREGVARYWRQRNA